MHFSSVGFYLALAIASRRSFILLMHLLVCVVCPIGVYLTLLPPTVGKIIIVQSCWGFSLYPQLVQEGRVEYVIRVRLPKSTVKKGTKKPDVYLYQGKLVLKDYDWEDSRVPDM